MHVPLVLREPVNISQMAEVLWAAVKVTENALAASCQLLHRKTYGNILQCRMLL